MTGVVLRFVFAALPLSVAAGIAMILAPDRQALVLDVYLLCLGGLILLALVRATRGAHPTRPSAFEQALRPVREKHGRPDDLIRLEGQVTLATAAAIDLYRFRPILQEAAAGRLLRRHGVHLEREPDRARRLLGDDAWEIVRPGHDRPREAFAPGLPLDRLTAAVEAIERM